MNWAMQALASCEALLLFKQFHNEMLIALYGLPDLVTKLKKKVAGSNPRPCELNY